MIGSCDEIMRYDRTWVYLTVPVLFHVIRSTVHQFIAQGRTTVFNIRWLASLNLVYFDALSFRYSQGLTVPYIAMDKLHDPDNRALISDVLKPGEILSQYQVRWVTCVSWILNLLV
jgi:hypothetical protein